MLIQHYKEQLIGGFADQLKDDMVALEKADLELRQLYDTRDLQVCLCMLPCFECQECPHERHSNIV